MERIEIDLAQGWSKGIRIAFENIESGKLLKAENFLHVEQVHGNHIHELGVMDLNKSSPLTKADGILVRGDLIEMRRALFAQACRVRRVFGRRWWRASGVSRRPLSVYEQRPT